MSTEAVEDDDLEDYWQDLLPHRRRSAKWLIENRKSYRVVTVSREARRKSYDDLHSRLGPCFKPVSAIHTLWYALQDVWVQSGMRIDNLIEASRKRDMNALFRATNLGRYLRAGQNSESRSVFSAAVGHWIAGGRLNQAQCAALGLSFEDTLREVSTDPSTILTRHLHLLLTGSALQLAGEIVIAIDGVEQLVETGLLSSLDRRVRAHELNTLLEECDKWDRRASLDFPHKVMFLLVWSGQEQDALLLRHLCEPLMDKLHAAKG